MAKVGKSSKERDADVGGVCLTNTDNKCRTETLLLKESESMILCE